MLLPAVNAEITLAFVKYRLFPSAILDVDRLDINETTFEYTLAFVKYRFPCSGTFAVVNDANLELTYAVVEY